MATARNLGAGLNLGDRVELQDLVTGEVIVRFPSQAAYVWDAQFSPDGRRAVTVDMSSIIQIWDARSGQRLIELKFPGADSLSFSPDGRRVVVLSYDKVAVLDSTTAEQICQIKAPRDTARPDFFVSTQFSPDGKLVLTEQCDGVTRIWDAVTGQQTQMFSAVSATDRFWPCALFTPDGRRVISGSDDGIAILWDVEAGNEIRRFQIPGPARGPVDQMIISCDGKRLIATCKSIATGPPAGALWDVESGRLIKQFDDLERERIVGFSPIDETFVSTKNGKPAALWNSATGRMIRDFSIGSTRK